MTKLHLDLSDSVNILVHHQRAPGEAPRRVRCGRTDTAELPGCFLASGTCCHQPLDET